MTCPNKSRRHLHSSLVDAVKRTRMGQVAGFVYAQHSTVCAATRYENEYLLFSTIESRPRRSCAVLWGSGCGNSRPFALIEHRAASNHTPGAGGQGMCAVRAATDNLRRCQAGGAACVAAAGILRHLAEIPAVRLFAICAWPLTPAAAARHHAHSTQFFELTAHDFLAFAPFHSKLELAVWL